MPIIVTILLVGTLLVGAGFAVERLVARRVGGDFEEPAAALVTGWALLVLVAVLCAVARVPLTVPTLAVGIVGVVGYFAARDAAAGFGRLAFAWLLLVPLLAIASVVPGMMHDEFPYLLPNLRGLVETDRFPDSAYPNVWTSKPEYPPAFSLPAYAAVRLGGHDVAYPGKMFTVLLAGAFGLALARLLAERIGRLAAIGAGVVLASVLNPFFDPRIALTSYYDTPTGFVLAFCVIACWRALDARLSHWHVHAAAAAVVLIMLRETNVIFVAALMGGLLVCRQYRSAAGMIPALMTFGLWRIYIVTAGITPTVNPIPFSTWDWSLPVTMLRVLFVDRLANNPVLGVAGVAFAVTGAALAIWAIRFGDRSLRVLFLLAGAVSAAWLGFLVWVYAAVFDEQALTANSAWRYISQLGPLLIYVIVAALVAFLPARQVSRRNGIAAALGVAVCLVPVLAIPATWRHWRIDCRFPEVQAVRDMTGALARLPLGNEAIAVIHPEFGSWFSEAIDYDLSRPIRSSRNFPRADLAPPLPYRFDLSAIDRAALIATREVPPVVVERRAGESWTTVLDIPGFRLSRCTSPLD